MKKIYILACFLLLASMASAGTYDKDIQIAAGDVGIDSVRLRVEVNNTKIDSALWTSFPVDSFITLPDTAILTISYWFYFSDDAGTFTTAYEQIDAADKTTSVNNNVIGIYAVDTSGTDDSVAQVTITVKDAGGNPWRNLITGSDGFATANLSNGNWTFIGSQNGYVFIDTTINVTADDTLSIKGYDVSVPNPPSATTATAFGDIRDLTGTLIPNATVIATLPGDVTNSCDSTWKLQANVVATTKSSGRFEMTLVKSSCFDNQAYTFTAYKTIAGILQKIKGKEVVIPSDSTTFKVW